MFANPRMRRAGVVLAALVSLSLGACAPEAYAPHAVPVANQGAHHDAVPAVDDVEVVPSLEPVAEPAVEPDPEPVAETPEVVVEEEPTAEPGVEEPETTSTPEVVPVAPPILRPGDDNEQVRELQHRLLQINWLHGKITSSYDDATRLAVEGFQVKRELPGTGEVDQATWDRLLDMTRTPTHDEMHNILTPGPALYAHGSKGDEVKDVQARLKQLKWYFEKIDGAYGPKTVEAVEGFQAKREIPVTGEVDQRTLDRLYSMTRKPTTDELNNIVAAPKSSELRLDDRCLQGRVVCVSKKQRKLAWVIDGKVQMTMDVRFGSELTPTREGTFSIGWKSRNHVSKLYGSKMPFALFFSGGQAVHYSSDFAARGYNGSSKGCVNVRDKAAAEALFEATRTGDKVVVFVG
ncbi:MAG: L,D-transpeptidase family protein [Propionibacteriaceae bacterium]|nr:L,D-transpeptidase family protein [Propionibacteriaceae bacterium]